MCIIGGKYLCKKYPQSGILFKGTKGAKEAPVEYMLIRFD
jgi:hypothetical protein